MSFYMLADEKEIQFYKKFEVKPITNISKCSFRNLYLIGEELGEDVCERAEQDPTNTYGCDNCPKEVADVEWYPPIHDDVLISILLICGTEGIDEYKYSQKLVDKILDYAFVLSLNKEVKERIHDVLVAYVENYWRK